METKLILDPQLVLDTWKDIGDADMFSKLMIAAAYYVKYRGKLPKRFETYQELASYFKTNIEPILNGKPIADSVVGDDTKSELVTLINQSNYFDEDERKVLVDMLDLWWGRGKYARTELIYTQSMCLSRTGVDTEKFVELRKWLKAEDCLNWENRPYGDYITSYHTFNEAKLLEVLRAEQNNNAKLNF